MSLKNNPIRREPVQRQFSLGIDLEKSKNDDSLVSLKSGRGDGDYTSRNFLGELSNHSSNSATTSDSWSLSTDSILIENLKSKPQGNTAKFTLRNNLPRRELEFSLKYSMHYLNIHPCDHGILGPLKTLEFTVSPRIEMLDKLPWTGDICIFGNKKQKDIRVILFPTMLSSLTSDSSKNQFHAQSQMPVSKKHTSAPSSYLNANRSNSATSLKSALFTPISANGQQFKSDMTSSEQGRY